MTPRHSVKNTFRDQHYIHWPNFKFEFQCYFEICTRAFPSIPGTIDTLVLQGNFKRWKGKFPLILNQDKHFQRAFGIRVLYIMRKTGFECDIHCWKPLRYLIWLSLLEAASRGGNRTFSIPLGIFERAYAQRFGRDMLTRLYNAVSTVALGFDSCLVYTTRVHGFPWYMYHSRVP